MLLADSALRAELPTARSRSTTIGALPHRRRHDACTGAVALRRPRRSRTVVAEIAATRVTERGETRADDRVSEAAMEDRKREGYF